MNGSTGPPSDMTAMGSENDEGGPKVRRGSEDTTAATSSSPSSSGSAAPYPILQADQPEYRGQGSIRANSASPLPTTSSSSSSSSLSSSSSPPPSPLPPPPPPPPGCGCIATTVLEPDEITISITPTTGGQFDLTVDRTDTVENLKKIISKRLKVAKERICLLHRERLLREGTLEENRLQDGSRLTLLPSVETGLLTQRPEQSVLQALESLNDSQVNDFLSGKAPLNLTMRLGDHLMLIQLQLSTVTHVLPTAGLVPNGSSLPTSHVSTSLQSRRSTVPAARATASALPKLQNDSAAARTSSLTSSLASALRAAVSCSTSLSTATTTTSPVCSSRATTASSVSSTSYSPVSPPHSSFCTSQSQSSRTSNHGSVSPTSNSSACQSCLLYHHNHQHYSRYHHHHHNRYNHHHHNHSRYHHHHRHHRHHHLHHSRNKPTTSWTSSQSSSTADHLQQSTSTGHGCSDSVSYDATPPRKKLCIAHHHNQQSTSGTDSSRSTVVDGDTRPQSPTSSLVDQSSKTATLDTRALAEASRNLTQKLKQLSSEVLTSRVDLAEENVRRRHRAILEGMHRHGKGVYSGTFSGTLKTALQDPHGRPKRDISTIVHILNDLICATPSTEGHHRYHYRFINDRQQSSTSTSSTGTTTTANGATTPTGCRDSSTPGYSTEELSKENEATRGKMRRLRLVMEQRRAKRKARRQARSSLYTTQWAAVTPDPDPNHDPNTSTASSSAGATNTTEPQNEPELQPCSPEPVVA